MQKNIIKCKNTISYFMAIIMLLAVVTLSPAKVLASDVDEKVLDNRNSLFGQLMNSNEAPDLSRGMLVEIGPNEELVFFPIYYIYDDAIGFSYINEKDPDNIIRVGYQLSRDCAEYDGFFVQNETKEYIYAIGFYLEDIEEVEAYSIYDSEPKYESTFQDGSLPEDQEKALQNSLIAYMKNNIKIVDKYLKEKCNYTFADLGYSSLYSCTHDNETIHVPTDVNSKKDGETGTKCKKCGEKSTKVIECPTKISIVSSVTYNGKAQKPAVKVTTQSGKKIDSKNYSVYYSNNTKVGKATVKVVFNGKDYKGSLTTNFKINPKGTSISKLSTKSRSLTITLKKQTKETSGYEIWVSTDKNFKKSVKKLSLKNNKTKYTLKKLTKNKKYYVKVRTYKSVSKQKYYSIWSKVKYIKIK